MQDSLHQLLLARITSPSCGLGLKLYDPPPTPFIMNIPLCTYGTCGHQIQLTPNKATLPHERNIADLSAAKTKTLVTRARICSTLIPANHNADFARGYKPIVKLVLSELLDDKSALFMDLW